MKKRPDVLKSFGERFSRLIKNPTQSKDKNPPKIKQKDLTKFMGCAESNIKEWKDGNWDLSITAIYLIVEYIQDKFTGSTPMHDLFPDLLAKEKIQDSNENDDERERLKNRIKKLKEELVAIKAERDEYYEIYTELHKACYGMSTQRSNYFKELLKPNIFARLFLIKKVKEKIEVK